MFRRLFLISIFLFGGMLVAQDRLNTADLSSLPKEKQLEIQQAIEAAKKSTTGVGQSTPEQVSRWVGLGKEVAELIPVFAEKTGIAADKVLNSFSGKVLLTIVLVHFFWGKLIGILLLTVGTQFWWQWFKRMFLREKCEQVVHPNPILAWFGFTKTLTTYKPLRSIAGNGSYITDTDTFWLGVATFLLAAIVISSLIALLA
jgi:hypothetical protein